MNTQTDNAAAGTQVHSLVKHHQQHGSNSGNSSGSGSNSSSNSMTSNSSNPVLGNSNNDKSNQESSNSAVSASSSSSSIAHLENVSSTSNTCIQAGTPLLHHQFTHHPPQHLLQHQHQHCAINHDNNSTSTNLHISAPARRDSSSVASSSSSVETANTASEHAQDSTNLHLKLATRTTQSSIDPACLARDQFESPSQSLATSSTSLSPSLSFPLFYSSTENHHSSTSLVSRSIPERRPSQPIRTESSSSNMSDSSSSICDARNPRTSAACFVGLEVCNDNNKPESSSSSSGDLNCEYFLLIQF